MKKTLSVVAILALVVTMLPAAFAQTSDQTSPSSSAPGASSPAASSSASQGQTSPAQTSPAQTSPSTPDQSSSAQGSGSAASQDAESFTGTVVKSGDKYVLKTDTGTYQIDDQDKAKQFEGKQVKVSGNLDKATSTLHVTDIQAAMQQ
jgi:Protein of unknown function (DUF5818)